VPFTQSQAGVYSAGRNLCQKPAFSAKGVDAMEALYFIAAFILLSALIYGSLHAHYRDRYKQKVVDQIVRDRYEHNRT